jgi:hypothetical protein
MGLSGGKSYSTIGRQAVTAFSSQWQAVPFTPTHDKTFYAPLTHYEANAKQNVLLPTAVHLVRGREYAGNLHFDRNGYFSMQLGRGKRSWGSSVNVIDGAEWDPTKWPLTPGTVATQMGNDEPESIVYLLNGCYSGTPEDRLGNVITLKNEPNTPPRLSAYDQGYFGIDQKKKFAVLFGDTANYRPINPLDPSSTEYGAAWWNARENVPINITNILAARANLQRRRTYLGEDLMFGHDDTTLELWCAPARLDEAKTALEWLAIHPGVTPISTPITGDGGLTNFVYGTQTNTALGRAKPVGIRNLREDLWCLVEKGGPQSAEYMAFGVAHGGSIGEYALNDDFAAPENNSVPHIFAQEYGPKSALWDGLIEGSKHGDVGMFWILNQGVWCLSPIRIEFNFIGSAS